MAGHIIKVMMEGTHPPVWRRIVIPDMISFGDLHRILQTAFQWENEHMHDFTFPGTNYRVMMEQEGGKADETENTVQADEFLRSSKYVRYTYDFGDDWQHKIVLEKDDLDYRNRYAAVIKYKGDSFEEDSGGVWGYKDDDSRVPFDMEEVNQKLQNVRCPVCKDTGAGKKILKNDMPHTPLKKLTKEIEKLKKSVRKFMEEIDDSEMAKRVGCWNFYMNSMKNRGN